MILLGQLNFFCEMLIPVLLMMRRQERRKLFLLRLLPVAAVAAALAFMPAISIGPFGVNYIIVFALVFLAGWFLFNVSPLDALFYTVAGFAVQHGLWDILFMIYDAIGEIAQPVALAIYFFAVLCGLYFVLFLFPRQQRSSERRKRQRTSVCGIWFHNRYCVYNSGARAVVLFVEYTFPSVCPYLLRFCVGTSVRSVRTYKA